MVRENDAGFSCRLDGNTVSLIIYTFLLPHCALETKHTQSARDINTVRVCARACTDCVYEQTMQIIAKTQHIHPGDNIKWHLDKQANLCTVMYLGKMSELDQSHESHASDQGKCEGGEKKSATHRAEEWQRLTRRIKSSEGEERNNEDT